MQALTLPGKSKNGWEFAPRAVLDAIDFLGLKDPVLVKLSQGRRVVGCHRYRDGVHSITVSTFRDAEGATETLWHELTHAAQQEALGSREAFRREYNLENQRHGYRDNRYEVEARANAAAMAPEYPLTRKAR